MTQIDWQTINNPKAILKIWEPFILKIGKRRFVKCVPDKLGVRVKLVDLVAAGLQLPKDVLNTLQIDIT